MISRASRRNILKIIVVTSIATFTVLSHYKAIEQQKQIRTQYIKNIKFKTTQEQLNDFMKIAKKNEVKLLAEKKRQEELKKQKEESEWIPVRLSFYTNDNNDCGKSDGISSSGKHLNRGDNFIAAPHNIPYGTKLYIEKLGDVFEVQDRGGSIVWNDGVMHLDVFIPNVSQSYLNKLGVKYTRAKIIK